jgi:hypothetical protein
VVPARAIAAWVVDIMGGISAGRLAFYSLRLGLLLRYKGAITAEITQPPTHKAVNSAFYKINNLTNPFE